MLLSLNEYVSPVRGIGDAHNTKYNSYVKEINLTPHELFTENSPTFRLKVYPNDKFFQAYSTPNLAIATVGAVGIIIATSLAFLLYNRLVSNEFHRRQAVYSAKRQFLRFISHEVRTPLQSVVLGLQLLKEEVSSMIYGEKDESQVTTHAEDDPVALRHMGCVE